MRVVSNKKEAKQCLHAPFYASIFMDPCGGVQARRARAYAARPTCSSCCACACASCCCCAAAPCCAWALEIISWRRTVRRAVRRAPRDATPANHRGRRSEDGAASASPDFRRRRPEGSRTGPSHDGIGGVLRRQAARGPSPRARAPACGAPRAARRRPRAARARSIFFVTLRLGIRELRRSWPAAPCKQTNKQTIFGVSDACMHACMHACMLFSALWERGP